MDKKKLMKENEQRKKAISALWGVAVFFLLIFIDQATKILADACLEQGDKIAIIPGWIYLRITYNPGIAYGQLGNAESWVKILIVALTAVLMVIFAVVFFKTEERRSFLRASLVMIVAGGVGNLIDRVYFRVWEADVVYGVRDMVDLDRFGFAGCNFADFFICIGAVMLVLSILFFDKEALFPVGKYKAMAEELELAEEVSKNETSERV